MRILHVCYGTPGDAGGGGHSFYRQNLLALRELGHDVHLCIVAPEHPLAPELAAHAHSVSYAVPIKPSKRSLDALLARVFRPETLQFRFPDWQGLRDQVHAAAVRFRPDAIWVDWIGCLLLVPSGLPTVYGHLDFIYQLQKVRSESLRRFRRPDILSTRKLERLELELCARASAIASVSATDVELLRRHGMRAVYLPIVGEQVARHDALGEKPRIFFFGRENTAMQSARRHFKEVLWPELERRQLDVEWHQVGGDLKARTDPISRWVCERFTVHGFVADLASVFRAGDICLVCYTADTGFRAKFVTAAAYGMINAGYDVSFACAPEFKPGVDCISAPSPAALADAIAACVASQAERAKMARAARELYEREFTLPAVLPKYRELLSLALGAAAPTRAVPAKDLVP